MRDAAISRRWLTAAGLAAALILGVFLGASWLSGPRASLVPTSPGVATSSGTPSSPTPIPTRGPGLPDPARTPGSINPNVTQDNIADTICVAGWTKTVRPPSAYTSALKFAQIIEYGYDDHDRSHYEEDHLVPLELGGAPRDPRNLWPEPLSATLADGTTIGAKEKDDLENELHRRVCAGTMLLADAQRAIAGDWIAVWESMGRP